MVRFEDKIDAAEKILDRLGQKFENI